MEDTTMMYGVMDGDNHMLNNIFRNREHAQHYADTLNERIHCDGEYTVEELYIAD